MDERGRDRQSTPPESAQMTRPSEPVAARVRVDALADLGDRRVDEVGRRPGRLEAGDADDEVAQDVAPRGVCTTSGWNWIPYRLRSGAAEAGERRRVGLGRRPEALRQPRDRVAVAHPDRLLRSMPANRPSSAVIVTLAGPYSRGRRQDVAAELVGHQLGAVADPEDGDPAGPDGRVRPWRIDVVDRDRAAREDDRAGSATLQLLSVVSCGKSSE